MTEEKLFDVLICDAATETVKSVAGYALPLHPRGLRPSAASVFVEISPLTRSGLILEIAEAGQYRPGDVLEPSQERLNRIRRLIYKSQKGDGYSDRARARMADCLCIRCGSPNIVNAIHCEPCAQLNRERVSKSHAKSL